MTRAPAPAAPDGGEPLRAAHVMAALAERIPAETVVVEETPSSRPDLHRLLPARRPLGFLSAAMGGLGFALPAAIGVRMAAPERPVVAVVVAGLAESLGCPARRVTDHAGLVAALDEVVPTLRTRIEPLVLEVTVAP